MSVLELPGSVATAPISWTNQVRELLRRYAAYREKRCAVAQLKSLSPRMLKDIAIDRSEIDSVVYGGSHGRRRRYGGG